MEWISVKDRLPRDNGDYLVTDGAACMVAQYIVTHQKWIFWDNGSFWDSKDVTHWMPLPKRPK